MASGQRSGGPPPTVLAARIGEDHPYGQRSALSPHHRRSGEQLSLEAPRALEETIAAVQHGGVVAFPTDTVFGLGASLRFPEALDRIYAIKGRDSAKSLPVLLSSIDRIPLVAEMPDPAVRTLLREFWPGGLTVVLPARPGLPSLVIAPDGTVGVRVPDYFSDLRIVHNHAEEVDP